MKAYVLAGGSGSRLSPDKGFIKLGGRTILERVCAAAAPLVTETVLVGPAERLRETALRVITEEAVGGVGPLAALGVALADAGSEEVLLLPWDAPFVSTPLLQYLAEAKVGAGADVAVPRRGEEREPLCAVYGPVCLEPVRRALAWGRRRVIAFYPEVSVRWVEEEELRPLADWDVAFLNVNTPDDLERARRLAAALNGGGE